MTAWLRRGDTVITDGSPSRSRCDLRLSSARRRQRHDRGQPGDGTRRGASRRIWQRRRRHCRHRRRALSFVEGERSSWAPLKTRADSTRRWVIAGSALRGRSSCRLPVLFDHSAGAAGAGYGNERPGRVLGCSIRRSTGPDYCWPTSSSPWLVSASWWAGSDPASGDVADENRRPQRGGGGTLARMRRRNRGRGVAGAVVVTPCGSAAPARRQASGGSVMLLLRMRPSRANRSESSQVRVAA